MTPEELILRLAVVAVGLAAIIGAVIVYVKSSDRDTYLIPFILAMAGMIVSTSALSGAFTP